ncbi:DUF2381 family protein [Cystobacter fuscus]
MSDTQCRYEVSDTFPRARGPPRRLGPGQRGLEPPCHSQGGFSARGESPVTVRFADGAAPASATFWLVGHAARGTRRVEVFREPRPAGALKRDAAEARAEARQCQEDKAQLLGCPASITFSPWRQLHFPIGLMP